MSSRTPFGLAVLVALAACSSTPDDPGAYVPEAAGPELQAKKRRYTAIKKRFVKKQSPSSASLNQILTQPESFKNVVVPRVQLTWIKVIEWDRVDDGITPDGSQDAQVSVASAINPGVTARVAISAYEWDAHRSILESLDNTNIEAALFVPEDPAGDCVGRILGLRVLEGEYRSGKREGSWLVKDISGVVRERGSYQDGKRVGSWTFFWSDGSKYREGLFVDGAEDGPWKNYFTSGRVSKEGAFDKGAKDGPWTVYYLEGEVDRRMKYKGGLLDGPWERFYRDGQPQEKGAYENGAKSGPWTYYHSNGVKSEEGSYTAGAKDGPWTSYDLDGVALERKVWSGDELIRSKKLN